MSMSDYLWSVQYKIIRELAEKEPCVIVGRCGDYVLEDRDDCLHVFIHAPLEFKKERILRLYGERKEKPEKRLEEKDKKRKLYLSALYRKRLGEWQKTIIFVWTAVL